MNSLKLVGRSALAAALIGFVAAPMAHADGTKVPGGSIGQSLYKAGSGNIMIKYLGQQAGFTNDLYLYLTIGGGQFILRNQTAVGGQNYNVPNSDDAHVAVGAETIFSICANLNPSSTPGTGCSAAQANVAGATYYTGPQTRNPDGRFHAAVWTTADFLAGCASQAYANCNPGVATWLAGAQGAGFNYVVGFEDSYNYSIDSDFNDVVFAVSNVTTTPEPVTMTLLATGLAGMSGVGVLKRRNKKA